MSEASLFYCEVCQVRALGVKCCAFESYLLVGRMRTREQYSTLFVCERCQREATYECVFTPRNREADDTPEEGKDGE